MPILLILDIEPVSWLAPKFSRGRTYDLREADKRVTRYLIREQYKGELIDRFVFAFFLFVFKVPQSYSKKKRAACLRGEFKPEHKDCTNLQKLYEDCLQGTVIKNDRKVAPICSDKIYGEKGKVIIFINY